MQSLLENAASLNFIEAQAEANRLSSGSARYPTYNEWVSGKSMPLKDTQIFLFRVLPQRKKVERLPYL